MYNLIVSAASDSWDGPNFSIGQDRFLEYTEDQLLERFRDLSENTATVL